jgi:hypothetical protein
MKIFNRGSMMQEHRKQQANVEVEDSCKAINTRFEIFLKH